MARPGRLTQLSDSVLRRVRPWLPPSAGLVVALSGGADSAVLAWSAAALAPERVRAVHIHHGLAASGALALAAQAVAEDVGLALQVRSVTVEPGASPEGRARAARQAELEGAILAGELILTGHTEDDQAETVLAHLMRGAGTAGLAGIPRRRGRWVRPLLDVSRSETRELAGLLGLPWRDDPANLDPAFRRNVVRRRLLPQLESGFNPALRRVLSRTAAALAADDAYLEERAAAVAVGRDRHGWPRVSAGLLASLPPPVAARGARRLLRVPGDRYAGRARDVEAVLAVARGERLQAALGGGLTVERDGAWVVVHGEDDAVPWAAVPLTLPGGAVAGGWRVDSLARSAPPSPWPLGGWSAVFDAAAMGEEAVLRPAAAGDRLALAQGSKPVREVLAEAGVPVRHRAEWPVLEAAGRPAWVVGVRTAAWAWVGPDTTRYLWAFAEEATDLA